MNDLGLTLAWLSLQVAVLIVPALGLQSLAARRGPRSGAWVPSGASGWSWRWTSRPFCRGSARSGG